MYRILYIGNNLNTDKANISSIQTLGALLESEGYDLRYASSKRNKLFRLLHMIWSCIWNSRWADGVLIDTYSTQNFYYALICSQICRFLRIPYFPILHGGNLASRLKNSPKLSQCIFNNSKLNISPSKFLKSEFESFGYSKIKYIPNSIQLKKYEVNPKTFDSIKLLWVRSFSKIYNPEMAIRVLKSLKDKGFNAQLCMVGPDSDGSLNAVKALAKKLDVHPKFTGKLTKEEWIKISEGHNIFMNTTNYDNMPVSIIEAMALGFPIVSTNVGGIPFLIRDGEDGLLSDSNNEYEMTKNIIRIFEDKKLRAQLSINARQNAEQFDWESIKKQWLSNFKAL